MPNFSEAENPMNNTFKRKSEIRYWCGSVVLNKVLWVYKKEIFHSFKVRCWLALEWYGTLQPPKIYLHSSWICCVTENIFISTHHTKYTLSCQEIKPNYVIELFIFTLAQVLHKVWFILSVATCKHMAYSPKQTQGCF